MAWSACKKADTSAVPFVPCMTADVPQGRRWSVGALSLESKDRTLTIKRGQGQPDVAIARGPAPFESSLRLSRACLEDAHIDVLVLLGDYGDRKAALLANLATLATAERVVLLLPGGRDGPEVLADAVDEDARNIIDLSPYERVIVGEQPLVVVAGAPRGFGRSAGACGFDASMLTSRLRTAELSAQRPILLSWAAPQTDGVGLVPGPAGDPSLRELASRLGARQIVSAFPASSSGSIVSDVAIVPPIGGAKPSRAGGAFSARGFAVLDSSANLSFRACF